jgi:hypothetical protein
MIILYHSIFQSVFQLINQKIDVFVIFLNISLKSSKTIILDVSEQNHAKKHHHKGRAEEIFLF